MRNILLNVLILLFFSGCSEDIKDSPEILFSGIQITDRKDILELIDKELEDDPDNEELLLKKSELLAASADWAEVDSTINKLLEKDPEHQQGLFIKAKADYNLGRINSAVKNAEELFIENYQAVDLNLLLFIIYTDRKELLKALDHINIALEKNPSDPEYYFYRGSCYLQLNDTVKGLKNLESAFSLGYSNTTFLNKYLVLLIELDRRDQAIEILDKTLDRYPDDIELQYTYAYLLDKTEQSGEAKQLLLRIASLDKEFLKSRSLLAEIYYRNRQYDSVFVMTNYIQQLDSTFLDSYYIEAKAYRMLGRHYAALSIYSKILELDPNNPIALEESDKLRNYLAYLQRQKEEEEFENRPSLPVLKPKSIEN